MAWYTKPVKIPDKHFIGFQKREDSENLLGFMTPEGTDKGAEKRKETVRCWAEGRWKYHQGKNKPVKPYQVLDNIKQSGFRLTFDIRHGYKGSPDAWRILDPRGFELEIRSNNLAQLMTEATIKNGVIEGECIWARQGAENILLSVNSKDYKDATKITEAINSVKVSYYSIKDIKPGWLVVLDNGKLGTYMGQYSKLMSSSERPPYNNVEYYPKKTTHVFVMTDENNTKIVYSKTSVKISAIMNDSVTYSAKEAEKKLFDLSQKEQTVILDRYCVKAYIGSGAKIDTKLVKSKKSYAELRAADSEELFYLETTIETQLGNIFKIYS